MSEEKTIDPEEQVVEKSQTNEERVHVCDRCGFKMVEMNCKVVCPNCGNRFDCSDLNIYLD